MLDKEIHRLFCEGADDLHVISALLNRRVDPKPFPHDQPQTHIIKLTRAERGDDGGFAAALRAFGFALEDQKVQRMGLVVDRDTPRHRRIDQILQRCRRVDVLWSGEPHEKRIISGLGETGVIMNAPDGRRWGIWLMPDNRRDGNLETFIEGLPMTHTDLQKHAEVSTKAASGMAVAYLETESAKARLHAYLAWTQDPGRPFGEAIQKEKIGVESDAANAFVDWFKRLFIDP